jgi:hypothetical protein
MDSCFVILHHWLISRLQAAPTQIGISHREWYLPQGVVSPTQIGISHREWYLPHKLAFPAVIGERPRQRSRSPSMSLMAGLSLILSKTEDCASVGLFERIEVSFIDFALPGLDFEEALRDRDGERVKARA